MRKTKATLSLGIVCLAAMLLQSIISVIAIVIPYLTFCVCSFIVSEEKRKLSNILRIILFGLVALPILDLAFSELAAPLSSELLSAVAVIFLQACIYFAAFVFVNTWISKKKNILKPTAYIILLSFIFVYSILQGIYTVSFMNSINQAIEQGSIFTWLSAIDSYEIFSIISNFVFYLGVFYASIQLSKKH